MSVTTTAPRKKRRRSTLRSRNSLPYENTTTGKNAVVEMEKNLRAFGATSFGTMEQYDTGDLLVQFTWRNRNVTIPVSGKGYAAQWLKKHPWSSRMRMSKVDYERRALEIGRVARYSILRDWIKGQITAVETGILSFDGAFLGQIMLASGETILERVEQDKLISLPPSTH
jgi:hypothetical protein